MGGYSDTGRRNTATPPSNMITNAMTFASTGCSMKNLANMMTPDAGQDFGGGAGVTAFDRSHLRPGTCVQDSIYHHAIVGSEAAREWRNHRA